VIRQHLRLPGHADSVVTQAVQNHCRVSITTLRPQQPSPKSQFVGGCNSSIPQIRMNPAQRVLEGICVLDAQNTPPRMRTRVGQIDAPNCANRNVEEQDDEQKTKSPSATPMPLFATNSTVMMFLRSERFAKRFHPERSASESEANRRTQSRDLCLPHAKTRMAQA